MQQLQRHSRGASACDLTRKAALGVSICRRSSCRRAPQRQASTKPTTVDMELVQNLKGSPFPPHTPLAGSIAGSFAYATISKRLPAILDTIIRDLEESAAAEPSTSSQFNSAAKSIEQLKQLITSDAELQQLEAPSASSPSLVAAVASTNACLQAWKEHSGNSTWFSLPWLIIECYMYVWINVALAQQPALAQQQYDPFYRQKIAAFTKSAKSVADMAGAVKTVLQATGPGIQQDQLKQQCFEVVQYALWGNKTDLSLLVDASQVDAAQLAAQVGTSKASPFLLVDDFEALWLHLGAPHNSSSSGSSSSSSRRVDIILDNSGVELFSDLCLADFLLASGLADSITFHGKPFPWFVSDVLPRDFTETIDMCAEPAAAGLEGAGAQGMTAIAWLGQRWQGHVASGKWQYTDDPFWCTPHPFWWMQPAAPALQEQLASKSHLLVFKGDLNYRKLAYDCQWPWATAFDVALGPFRPAPLVTLRTLKADVMAGLKEGQGEALGQVDGDWLVSGKYGVIQFAGRK